MQQKLQEQGQGQAQGQEPEIQKAQEIQKLQEEIKDYENYITNLEKTAELNRKNRAEYIRNNALIDEYIEQLQLQYQSKHQPQDEQEIVKVREEIEDKKPYKQDKSQEELIGKTQQKSLLIRKKILFKDLQKLLKYYSELSEDPKEVTEELHLQQSKKYEDINEQLYKIHYHQLENIKQYYQNLINKENEKLQSLFKKCCGQLQDSEINDEDKELIIIALKTLCDLQMRINDINEQQITAQEHFSVSLKDTEIYATRLFKQNSTIPTENIFHKPYIDTLRDNHNKIIKYTQQLFKAVVESKDNDLPNFLNGARNFVDDIKHFQEQEESMTKERFGIELQEYNIKSPNKHQQNDVEESISSQSILKEEDIVLNFQNKKKELQYCQIMSKRELNDLKYEIQKAEQTLNDFFGLDNPKYDAALINKYLNLQSQRVSVEPQMEYLDNELKQLKSNKSNTQVNIFIRQNDNEEITQLNKEQEWQKTQIKNALRDLMLKDIQHIYINDNEDDQDLATKKQAALGLQKKYEVMERKYINELNDWFEQINVNLKKMKELNLEEGRLAAKLEEIKEQHDVKLQEIKQRNMMQQKILDAKNQDDQKKLLLNDKKLLLNDITSLKANNLKVLFKQLRYRLNNKEGQVDKQLALATQILALSPEQQLLVVQQILINLIGNAPVSPVLHKSIWGYLSTKQKIAAVLITAIYVATIVMSSIGIISVSPIVLIVVAVVLLLLIAVAFYKVNKDFKNANETRMVAYHQELKDYKQTSAEMQYLQMEIMNMLSKTQFSQEAKNMLEYYEMNLQGQTNLQKELYQKKQTILDLENQNCDPLKNGVLKKINREVDKKDNVLLQKQLYEKLRKENIHKLINDKVAINALAKKNLGDIYSKCIDTALLNEQNLLNVSGGSLALNNGSQINSKLNSQLNQYSTVKEVKKKEGGGIGGKIDDKQAQLSQSYIIKRADQNSEQDKLFKSLIMQTDNKDGKSNASLIKKRKDDKKIIDFPGGFQ